MPLRVNGVADSAVAVNEVADRWRRGNGVVDRAAEGGWRGAGERLVYQWPTGRRAQIAMAANRRVR